VAAFDRFMVKPETTDKRCAAKIEILKALCKLEYSSPSVFRRGVEHVQMNHWAARWIPQPKCARWRNGPGADGLSEALEEIVPLLLDCERDARIGAVRPSRPPAFRRRAAAAAQSAERRRAGGSGECFAACCAPRPTNRCSSCRSSSTIMKRSLRKPPPGAGRLAAGERLCGAARRIQLLRARSLRRTLLLAIALLRRENAIDYLLGLVENGESQVSADAVAALAMYKDDPNLQARLNQARQSRTP